MSVNTRRPDAARLELALQQAGEIEKLQERLSAALLDETLPDLTPYMEEKRARTASLVEALSGLQALPQEAALRIDRLARRDNELAQHAGRLMQIMSNDIRRAHDAASVLGSYAAESARLPAGRSSDTDVLA